jgi:cytochrome c556
MLKAVLGFGLVSILLSGFLVVSGTSTADESKKDAVREAAIERTRREIRMLDDIYKTAVVLVTEHYVKDDTSLAAGSAFKALFEAVGKKGWHEVRLVDATGQPYSDLNLPKAGFEQKAIKALLAGKASYEEITTEGDKTYLLTATAIPVVMDKCIMCHENYRNVPRNQAIGALSYKVPLVE